ncbi:MAG: O-methyltransferase [Promethearchaeota archaeon]
MRFDIINSEWLKYYYKSKQHDGQEKVVNENFDAELEKVNKVLDELKSNGFLPHLNHDPEKFLNFREKVKESFFIFWTAISPPMEHLLYSISEILQPKNILGIGIFTGYPVVWSMGPAIDGSYVANKLVAVEIDQNNARICQDNFDELSKLIKVNVLPEDGFDVIERYDENEIDLLYLDASGFDPDSGMQNTKRINYSLLKKAYSKIKAGGAVLCHNAAMDSFKRDAADYLKFTENERFFEKTSGIYLDEMGLEFSLKNKI